jgi:HAMP domain-containing protein
VAAAPGAAAVAAFTVDDALAIELGELVDEAEVALLVEGRPVASSATIHRALLETAAGRDPAQPGTLRAGKRIGVLVPAGQGRPVAVLVAARGPDGPNFLLPVLGIMVAALVMAVGIAVLVARATTRPLGELGAAAARVAGGDLHTTIEVRSRDELGLLATSFNTMTEELRRYVGALRTAATSCRPASPASGTRWPAPTTSTGSCRSCWTPPSRPPERGPARCGWWTRRDHPAARGVGGVRGRGAAGGRAAGRLGRGRSGRPQRGAAARPAGRRRPAARARRAARRRAARRPAAQLEPADRRAGRLRPCGRPALRRGGPVHPANVHQPGDRGGRQRAAARGGPPAVGHRRAHRACGTTATSR